MYCGNCGKEISENFCTHCGKLAANTGGSTKESGDKSGKEPSTSRGESLSFMTICSRNQLIELQTPIFILKGKEVYLEITSKKGLKIDRRNTAVLKNVKVSVNDDPYAVKKAAFDKLSRYNPDFPCRKIRYCKLAYRSGERVRYLPGTNLPFTVKSYKEDLGVSYNRLTLYLLPYDDDCDSDVESFTL